MLRFLVSIFIVFFSILLSAGEVYLFQTTDLHGTVYDKGQTGAAPSVLTAIAEDADRVGRNKTLLIDCGDLLQGSLEAAEDQGASMIRLLNAAKFDVWVPGNHDFEYGSRIFSRRVNEFNGTTLAANLKFAHIRPFRIFEKNGIRIAVVGMTNPHLGQWLFRPEEQGFHILPVEIAYRQALTMLRRYKPDLIVLAIHAGVYPSKRLGDPGLFVFARRHPEARLILGGHTHEKVICKSLGDNGVCFFQGGAHGGGYIRIKLNFHNRTRRLLEISGEYVPVTPRKSLPADFRIKGKKYPAVCSKFPVKPDDKMIAEIFARAIMKKIPRVNGVFHGKLTKFRPRYPKLTKLHLFQLCPFENKVLIAWLNKAEFEAIEKEQKKMEKFGMRQYYTHRPTAEKMWNKGTSPEKRYPFAFNSYVAAGAGGRFPVLKEIIDSPAAEAELKDIRIFDLLESYVKEVYK